ncbi:hypothetical protein LTR84_010310 [Exophiala bonariae]|uniref:Uncharacterized protein n=1 Tax=Exophiala bonariae TaxID=1690606 RepID=A0AAV9MWL3_9EURO|nr:hypothetical protein LTR84_010310 [Exophiala bonariae]
MTVTAYRSISSMVQWILRPVPSAIDWLLISTSRSVLFSIAAVWSFVKSIAAHWREFLSSQYISTATKLWSKIIVRVFQVFSGIKVVESLNDQIRELKEKIAMNKAQLEQKDNIITANNKQHADDMAKEQERSRDERVKLLQVQWAQGAELEKTDEYHARAEYCEQRVQKLQKKTFEQRSEADKRDEVAQRRIQKLASQLEQTKTALATSGQANQGMQDCIQKLSSDAKKSDIKIQTLIANNARLSSNVLELGAENARLKQSLQSASEQNEHLSSANALLRNERDVAVENWEIIARQKKNAGTGAQ